MTTDYKGPQKPKPTKLPTPPLDGPSTVECFWFEKPDAVNPIHYRKHPSGVECIQVTEHLNFCRGNAVKYIWRAGEKGDELEDLKKAEWYIQREIARVEKERGINSPKSNT